MTDCNPGASRETLNNGNCTPGNRGEADRGKAEERAVAPLQPSLSPEKPVTAGREAACPNQRLPRYRVPFAVEELPFDEAVALAADTGTALMDGIIDVDLFFNTYLESCLFGKRIVNIYVLETPPSIGGPREEGTAVSPGQAVIP